MHKTCLVPLELAPGVKGLGLAHRIAKPRCQLMEKVEGRKKRQCLACSKSSGKAGV